MTTRKVELNEGENTTTGNVRISRIGNIYDISQISFNDVVVYQMWADSVEICETEPNDADYTIVCVRAFNKGVYTGFIQFVKHVDD